MALFLVDGEELFVRTRSTRDGSSTWGRSGDSKAQTLFSSANLVDFISELPNDWPGSIDESLYSQLQISTLSR